MKTATLPGPTEAEIQTAIMRRLQMDGWCVVRVNSGGMKMGTRYFRAYIIQQLNASTGLPDIIAFRDGAFLMVEVKDAKGKLSKTQEVFREFAARFGITVHVLRSADALDEVLK